MPGVVPAGRHHVAVGAEQLVGILLGRAPLLPSRDDVAGRRIVVTNALAVSGLQQTNGFVYDGNGNLIVTFDALGRERKAKLGK